MLGKAGLYIGDRQWDSFRLILYGLLVFFLRLQYEVFCFALVISFFFFKCPLYPRFAKYRRSKKLPVKQIRCKRRARLKGVVNIGIYV